MKLIGITGGIGTGKSTVAEILRTRGWTVYSSDRTAKEVMASDPEVRNELAALLGTDALVEGGVNTGVIASQVFGPTPKHAEMLQKLDQIVHPRVLERHLEALEEERSKGTPLVAIESALLYEVGLEDGFDWVVVVDCPDELRIPRVMERAQLSEDEVRFRIDQQMPMQEKRNAADFVIENVGSLEDLTKATMTIATIVEALPDPEASAP